VAAAGAAGTVSVAERVFGITGNQATGATGSFNVFFWSLIDDTETANWILIDDNVATNWQNIDNVESADWTLIPTE
jgi:hypothetical protein